MGNDAGPGAASGSSSYRYANEGVVDRAAQRLRWIEADQNATVDARHL